MSVATVSVRADLNAKQARKVISRLGGLTFEERSIHVNNVNSTNNGSTNVVADVEAVFKLTQEKHERWEINEIRVGSGRWERLTTIAQAANLMVPVAQCDSRGSNAAQLTATKTRCLIAALVGVALPSDAVRVKEISLYDFSPGSRPLALVVTRLRLNLRLEKVGDQWRVTEVGCGNGPSLKIGDLYNAVNSIKRNLAKDELTQLASALEAFRKDRGSYVVAEAGPVLIDHLSPRYLHSVIRVDPWHYPYQYRGDGDHFTLTSIGPDGKPGTSDDVVVSK